MTNSLCNSSVDHLLCFLDYNDGEVANRESSGSSRQALRGASNEALDLAERLEPVMNVVDVLCSLKRSERRVSFSLSFGHRSLGVSGLIRCFSAPRLLVGKVRVSLSLYSLFFLLRS